MPYKLSNDDVEQIDKLLSEGVAASKIAEQFNIDRRQVYRIASGEQWKSRPIRQSGSNVLSGFYQLPDYTIKKFLENSARNEKGCIVAHSEYFHINTVGRQIIPYANKRTIHPKVSINEVVRSQALSATLAGKYKSNKTLKSVCGNECCILTDHIYYDD